MRILVIVAVAIFVTSTQAHAEGLKVTKKCSDASGTCQCHFLQPQSAYRVRLAETAQREHGFTLIDAASEVLFKVSSGGFTSVGSVPDIFPGTTFHAKVGGELFFDEDRFVRVSEPAIRLLEQDQPFFYSYTLWPSGVQVDGQDIFEGFAAARNECLAFWSQH